MYEIVKVIHDNGNEEVEDKKATDEDETGEEEVGEDVEEEVQPGGAAEGPGGG